MTRHIFAACGAVAIAGVALSAQSTSPSPSSTTQSPSMAGTITVQGCLKPASSTPMGSGAATSGTTGAGAAGTAGTSGTTGAGSAQFMLTDAEIKSGAATGATGTAGAGTTPPAAAGRSDDDEFLLTAESASVNLAQHVNHQVEIVGRKASAGATGTTGATGGTTAKPTLTVTSVKMLAAQCK